MSSLVVWTCPEKHPQMVAFLPPLASTLRFCEYVTGFDGERIHCGVEMAVCFDQRPKVEGPISEMASEDDRRRRVAKALREAQGNLAAGTMLAKEVIAALSVALKGKAKP